MSILRALDEYFRGLEHSHIIIRLRERLFLKRTLVFGTGVSSTNGAGGLLFIAVLPTVSEGNVARKLLFDLAAYLLLLLAASHDALPAGLFRAALLVAVLLLG